MTDTSSALPSSARAVIVGAGIVGNSLAYHLSELGWTDLVLLDKGPLPNPGGSTGHASNFIFPVDHSKEMTLLTLESLRQYKELGVFIESGGIEIARTEERMQELTRRMASAKAWGIEPVSLLNPEQVKELVPYINHKLILGGFHPRARRVEAAADPLVVDVGDKLLDLLGVQQGIRLDSPCLCRGHPPRQLLHSLLGACDLDPAALDEHAQFLVLAQALERQKRHLLRMIDREDEVGRVAGGAARIRQRPLVEQQHVALAQPRQVIRQAVTDDPCSDHDHLLGAGEALIGSLIRHGLLR